MTFAETPSTKLRCIRDSEKNEENSGKIPLLRTKYCRFGRIIVPETFGELSRRLAATVRRFYLGRLPKNNPANFAVRLPSTCSDVFTVTITIKTSERERLGSRFLRRQIADPKTVLVRRFQM